MLVRPSRLTAIMTLAMATSLLVSTSILGGAQAEGSSNTTTTTAPQTLNLPKNGHCTILVVGDSLGTDLAGGLGWQLSKSKNVSLVQKGKSSTGLSNSGFFNWPQHLTTYLKQYHPQLLIVFLGGNDEQGIEANGHAYAFNTPGWRTQYAKAVASMMNEATKSGTAVLWVGMPRNASDQFDVRPSCQEQIARHVLADVEVLRRCERAVSIQCIGRWQDAGHPRGRRHSPFSGGSERPGDVHH